MRKHLSKSFRSQTRDGLLIALSIAAVLCAIAFGVSSCKAWRTVSTTATYVQSNDSTKSSATITTKTTEEYVGIRRK